MRSVLRAACPPADHVFVPAYHLGDLESDLARTGGEVKDAHPGPDASALQRERCRFGNDRGLRLQSGDRVIATQNVLGSAISRR